MTTQGLSVYENAIAPPTPAANYRVLYPTATGWKELDSAGNARLFAKLDADDLSLTVAGGLNVGTATGATAGQIKASADTNYISTFLDMGKLDASYSFFESYDRVGLAYKGIKFLTLSTGNHTTMLLDTSGNVTAYGGFNVGSATGAGQGGVWSSADTLGRLDYLAHRNGSSNSLVLWRAGGSSAGTVASPQATASGDILLDIRTFGYQATTGAYTGALASIRFITSQAFTSTAQGTEIFFYVIPNGSTTTTQVLKLGNDLGASFVGRVGVGIAAAATHVFQIDGAYTTSGIALYVNRNAASASTDSPVVYFRQQNAGDDQHTLQLAQAGAGYALYIESGPVRWDGQNSTGTGAPTFANNKPTASSSTATWLKINIGGTNYYIPCWL